MTSLSSDRGDAAEKELRNSVKDPRKGSVDLNRDLSAAVVNVHSSTIRRLIERGRIARRPKKKQLLTTVTKKKTAVGEKQKKWDQQKWRQVIFSDESHFEVQGYRSQYVRRSENPSKVAILSKRQNTPRKRCLGAVLLFKVQEGLSLSKKW